MFQKSLQILVVCALLTLGAIVGYAVLRLGGPENALARARANFAAGNYGEVIADLDLAERGAGIANSPDLREQLWRLRYAAHSRLDNPAGALDDVRRLLQNGHPDDEDLLLDEVRLLARAGQGEQARLRGRAFVEAHPEHSRALELTGEACQTVYQPLLRDLQVTLERELGQSRREASRKSLLAYLYRPDGDPEIERAASRLEQMFETEPRLMAAWPDVSAQARSLRKRIQEGLSFFQRSLDLGGEPVAAFRAMATAFEQSGRIDDLLLACEIQRRMFDHAYVPESGAWAAWARIQAGLPRAALATVDRWLTAEEVPQRAADGKLGQAAAELALARAIGNWRLRDQDTLAATGRLVAKLREHGVNVSLGGPALNTVRRALQEAPDPEQTERIVQQLLRVPLQQPAPLDRPDLVAEFQPVLLDSMLARNAPEPEVQQVLESWRRSRPENAEPHLRTAQYLQTRGSTAAALAALADAVKITPGDPRLFPLRVAISAQHYENSGQSGPNLFAQCVENRKPVPDLEDPIGFVLCAQTALTQPGGMAARIALTNARAAIGAFPKANLPRQLELRALLAQQRYDEAAKTADLTIRAITPDAATLALAIEAKRLARQSLRQLVHVAMPRVPRTDTLQVELLRIALEDAPQTAAQFVDPSMLADDAPTATRVLAIRALVHNDQLQRAEQLLAVTPPQADDDDRLLLLGAFAEWVLARSEQLDDAALLPAAAAIRDQLDLAKGAQQPLLDAAQKLAAEHPATALDLLERALPAASPTERNGRHYGLAGTLAARQGDLVRAEARWLAALGFEDGVAVVEPLARLLLLQGREARARKVYALVDPPTDPALAARMGNFPIAAALVAQQLKQDPADLLVHATLATFGQFSLVDWVAATEPDLQNRRLELLSGLRDPALASLTLPRADAMLRADPSKQTHYLLLARATADAGLAPAASALHNELFKAGLLNPVLLREVAYAGKDPAYEPSKQLDLKLMDAVSNGGTAGSQLTLLYGTRRIVHGFEAGGFPEMARTTRLAQWLVGARLQPWTDADLELITTGHPAPQACFVLDQILQGPHAGDRQQVLAAFYELAPKALAADAKSLPALLGAATRHLAEDGALGPAVHFVLEHRSDKLPVDEPALLLKHLEMVATGRDDGGLLRASSDRLVARVGLDEAAMRVDELLEKYPTSVPLWALRTRLRTRLRIDGALDGMRTVLSHAQDPRAELSFFALSAAERNLTTADVDRLAQLPDALRGAPIGHYVQALFALRRGDAAASLPLFAEAVRQLDGRHLFLWALAELEAGDGRPATRAIERLEQLLRDYPSSSLARYAGSFVRQLSPR
jgi:hypothetical protein